MISKKTQLPTYKPTNQSSPQRRRVRREKTQSEFFSCERSTLHEQFRALRVTGRGAPHARAA